MIPEYKFYHGAVLTDIVDKFDGAVCFRETVGPGRLLNYVINDSIGLQIKYSTARLHPWQFTFPDENIAQIITLLASHPTTFVALVCHTDGFAAVPADILIPFLKQANGEQAWLRLNRKKREMYRVFGPAGEYPYKFRTTSEPIVEALRLVKRELSCATIGDAE
jgi:hypothetical protein